MVVIERLVWIRSRLKRTVFDVQSKVDDLKGQKSMFKMCSFHQKTSTMIESWHFNKKWILNLDPVKQLENVNWNIGLVKYAWLILIRKYDLNDVMDLFWGHTMILIHLFSQNNFATFKRNFSLPKFWDRLGKNFSKT